MGKFIVLLVSLILWSHSVNAACSVKIEATTPEADFVRHGDGTVTHTKTGLMWKICSESSGSTGGGGWDSTTTSCIGAERFYTWKGALKKAETINAAGGFASFSDWRVPNIKELHSIVERQCWGPAINESIFHVGRGNDWWSSTPVPTDSTRAGLAFSVHFSTSGSDDMFSKAHFHKVRLVRTVQ